MSNADHSDSERQIHYEHGIPVLETEIEKIERKQREAEDRDKLYRDAQLTINQQQLKVNNRLMMFTGFLVITSILSGAIAIWQGSISQHSVTAAKDSVNAANDSSYMACLTAQATQITFLQLQQGAEDSHASAAATVKQAEANLVSNRAVLTFVPHLPALGDLALRNQLAIPYIIFNTGKSEAIDAHFRMKAVLLKPDDNLVIDWKHMYDARDRYIAAGKQVPELPDTAQFKAVSLSLIVSDKNGKAVNITDPDAISFIGGDGIIAAIYGSIRYTDFFGVHKSRFCYPIWSMKPGTTMKGTKGMRTCNEYNHQIDRYAAMPRLDSSDVATLPTLKPIACEKPKH